MNQDKIKHILLTGPNSPLGQCFISMLIKYFPNSKFFSLSRSTKINNFDKYVSHIPFDLHNDNFYLSKNIDILIHVAAAVPATIENSADFFKINFEGTKKLIENLRFSDDAKILNISTSSVYDEPLADILYENSIKTKSNPYGLSKLMFDEYLNEKFKNSLIQVITCRVPVLLVNNVRNNFISNWLKNIKTGNPITLFNPQSEINACVTGNDILNFFLNILQQNRIDNLICNVSSSEPIKIIDAATFIMETLGAKVGIIEEASDVKAQLISHDLAKKNGFEPSTVIESLKSFVNYV